MSSSAVAIEAVSAIDDHLPGMIIGRDASIIVDHVSKWYGDIVAVSDVTFGVAPGVTALLGPNGAGKSTILKMLSGLINCSSGSITIGGQPARGKPMAYKRLGLVPEQETIYPFLSGREFVRMNAILQKVSDVDKATSRAISVVQMEEPASRKVGGYSKGMRQRIKVAAAIVHDPSVVLMDEPLNGTDPVQRAGLIALIQSLGESGKTVIVSSHILTEVERFAENILVIVNGKLAAAGDFRAIREKIDTHDHAVSIRADQNRRLAAALMGDPATRSIRLESEDRIIAETNDVRAFYRALPFIAKNQGIRLFEVQPADESLSSVFSYLVER
jgi:ABC-2 type transport system ATP-binding protein